MASTYSLAPVDTFSPAYLHKLNCAPSTMTETKVIIAGGGIAGPVLAMFLKAKEYAPVIYERKNSPSSLGLSLA